MKLSHFHVTLPKTGERLSGDAVVIREEADTVLLSVIDALGHGPAAAEVADRGHAFLETVPLSKSVLSIMEGLHDALRGTRGAAAMCCVLRSTADGDPGAGRPGIAPAADGNGAHVAYGNAAHGVSPRSRAKAESRPPVGRVEGCGVGNVELRVLSSRVPVILTPGILGVSLNRTRVFEGPVGAGARIIMFSDGISPRMELDRYEKLPPERACKTMVERYRRPHDDATLLVADVEARDG